MCYAALQCYEECQVEDIQSSSGHMMNALRGLLLVGVWQGAVLSWLLQTHFADHQARGARD